MCGTLWELQHRKRIKIIIDYSGSSFSDKLSSSGAQVNWPTRSDHSNSTNNDIAQLRVLLIDAILKNRTSYIQLSASLESCIICIECRP